MIRAAVLMTLIVAVPRPCFAQAASILHIKVILVDANQNTTPVPHHALLISDNPSSEAPRRIVTGTDGTANVRLRPGNYTVESDQPVAFRGTAYQWAQVVDIVAGRDANLELNAANAEAEPAASTTTSGAATLEADPSFLLPRWQDSVVAVWTPTTRGSGFVIDARGLVATSQRVVGTATAVEVQLTPVLKVAARVVVADAVKDVAILRIDPQAAASLKIVPFGCADAAKPQVTDGQEIFAIGSPLGEPKGMASGRIRGVDPRALGSDLMLASGSAGGPVFTAGGGVVGIVSIADEKGDRKSGSPVARVDAACDVVAAAERKMSDAAPPNGSRLPVEPVRPFPAEALKAAAHRGAGNLSLYQMSSSDFDITFITPVLAYGAENQPEPASGLGRRGGGRTSAPPQTLARPLADFSNWSEYVAGYPAVLLVRVTPKQVEGFWTTVARGAALTQGVSLPPIKHFKSGFSRLRAFCGEAEVTPIHPFRLEQRVSESDGIYEGLYAYDAGALGPQCVSVKLVTYSEKEPQKGETRVVDPKVIQQVWQDFVPFRDLKVEPDWDHAVAAE